MIRHIQNIFLGVCVALISNSTLHAMNLTRPYDSILKPPPPGRCNYQLSFLAEKGFFTQGFNPCNECVNVLQIWNREQDAIAMLKGFPDDSPITQLLNIIGPVDNGLSGHFNVCGNLKVNATGAVSFSYGLPNDLTVSAYLPFYSMSLCDVVWQDLTPATDLVVKNNLTNDIFGVAQELGGLWLGGWQRGGLGDLTLMLDWDRDFPQAKPFLKNVHLNGRIGVIVPTGLREDTNKILALPFGLNGATGLLVGAGLDLTFANVLRGGMHLDLTQIFGFTRCVRIKTQVDQTDLLLLAQVPAYEDFGMFQHVNLYIQFYKFYRGLSVMGAYQFWKQGDNVVSLATNDFNSGIANTAEFLFERTMHDAMIQITYDFTDDLGEDACIVPFISAYYKRPFNGRRAALTDGLGLVFAITF